MADRSKWLRDGEGQSGDSGGPPEPTFLEALGILAIVLACAMAFFYVVERIRRDIAG